MKSKKLYTLVGALLLSAFVWAQAPQKMSYQAVIRNSSNELLVNQNIGIRIGLVCQGDLFPSFEEVHNVTTNSAGVVSFQIGGGTSVGFGSFGSFRWSTCPNVQLEINVDPNGGTDYTIFSSQQLLSVPYALYAATSGSGGGDGGTTYTAGSGIQISGGVISAVDNSATNELQTLTLQNNSLLLSGTQSAVNLAPYLDNTDNQTLSLSGNTLSIARGNSITLPSGTGGGSAYWGPIAEGSSSIINSNEGNVTIGTNTAPTSAKLQVEHDAAFGTGVSLKNTNAAYMNILSVEDNGTSGNPSAGVGSMGNAAIKAKSIYGDAIFASSTQRGAYVQGGSDFYPAMKIATNAPGQIALEIDGALKINGGTAGQVLSVNDTGATMWSNAKGLTYNKISTHNSTGEVSITPTFDSFAYLPGMEKTINLTGNAKIIISAQIQARNYYNDITSISDTTHAAAIDITDNGLDIFSSIITIHDAITQTFTITKVLNLSAGTHIIKIKGRWLSGGSNLKMGDPFGTVNMSYMDVMIIEE